MLVVFSLIFGTVALGMLAYCAYWSSVRPIKTLAARITLIVICLAVLVTLGVSARNWYLESYWERQSHSPSYIIRSLGMGLLNYESAYKRFPPPRMNDHSWRIRLLPFLVSCVHYSEYDFESPWYSSGNMLLDRRPLREGKGPNPNESYVRGMPFEFGSSLDFPQQTRFVMIVGEDFFSTDTEVRRASDILDGVENTIALAETPRSDLHWLLPLDLNKTEMSYRVNDGPNSIGNSKGRMPVVCFCDGQVFYLNPKIPENALRSLLTINGREDIDRDTCVKNGWLIATE